MFVATADRGSMPNSNITGTVISEVLPVTTLIILVKKKTLMRTRNSKEVRLGAIIEEILNSCSNILALELYVTGATFSRFYVT
jgi:hypothetical protein